MGHYGSKVRLSLLQEFADELGELFINMENPLTYLFASIPSFRHVPWETRYEELVQFREKYGK